MFSLRNQWLVALGLLSGCVDLSAAASTQQWKTRSIYQTMTDRFALTNGSTTAPCNTTEANYCGGTWQGTIDKLDYIQGMGFDAVMISPVTKNIDGRNKDGEAYHGYWPLDLYELNSHFGTQDDLLKLSEELHARDMYLLLDVVINNVAYNTDGSNPATTIDYTVFPQFNGSSYFHPYCIITNWNNYTDAQICQTGDNYTALPDLYTEHTDVQDILMTWSTSIMTNYSVDGLRIDAAKSLTPSFLPTYAKTVGGWMTGEVMDSNATNVCKYQRDYLPSLPNYPLYYSMITAFLNGEPGTLLEEIATINDLCSDVPAMVNFIEDQDVDRWGYMNDDIMLAKNALTFMMLYDGIPLVYQGLEQFITYSNRAALWLTDFNTNATLYNVIAKLNAIRKHAISLDSSYIDSQTYPIYQGGSELAFWKGNNGRQVIMLLSTQGSNGSAYDLTLPMSYGASTVVTEVLNCVNYTVNTQSELIVQMDKGEPRVFFPADMMPGSGLCGYNVSNTTYSQLRLAAVGSSSSSGGSHPIAPFISQGPFFVALVAMLALWI
ncbi:alpha-amylase [Aspergillus sclerotioniger CBS 115572]|uniref:alpha-amylase n=1 Tax=Aspergillus sclerotioniger CBS 115572 TaxID=1450535 RepID=A0A317V8Z3_9EURO|nr:alpha-amylase [Aspergillus sclerotioniger CBS 115572]PWY70844.1 alpha-amylase [Aspergillus sclerotioniger CBS 115572]